MTTDEVKTYLRQAYKLDKRLQREQMKLEKLRSAVEYRSPVFDGIGGGGDGDTIGRAVESILERAEHVNELTAKYTECYKQIDDAIHAIGDETLTEVLERRYLLYQKWEDIAHDMHRDLRWIYRLHGKALAKIKIDH